MMTTMFVIQITGGREFNLPAAIYDTLKPYVDKYGPKNIIVRHGKATGADTLSHFQARKLNIVESNIQSRPVEYYGYSWKEGFDAGNKRNLAMLDEEPKPNIVLAFPDDNSKGTWNMIQFAKDRNIPVELFAGALSANNQQLQAYKNINADTIKSINSGQYTITADKIHTITIGNKHNGDVGIYVGRPSILGNPYKKTTELERNSVIESYRGWLQVQMQDINSPVYKKVHKLAKQALEEDITLVCWCSPKQCHADVIRDTILEINKQQAIQQQSIQADVEFGVAQELSAALLFADQIWPGCQLHRLPEYSDLDFIVTYRGELRAFIEVKARRNKVDAYSTTIVPERKHIIAKSLYESLKIQTFLVIVFEDALVSLHLENEPDRIEYIKRDDRVKGYDHCHYNTGRFTYHLQKEG